MNDDENWRSAFRKQHNARLKDQELILRFLAMHERGEQYSAPMRDFLDNFADEYNEANGEKLAQLKALFAKTIKACWEALGRKAFRPERALNAAVFEGVMLGVAARLEQGGFATPDELAKAYDCLLEDRAFMRACERATAVEDSVRIRRTNAVRAFARPHKCTVFK